MFDTNLFRRGLPTILLALMALPAAARSFRGQCPEKTNLHPTAPTTPNPAGGQIKCQQVSGGDGYATMADGTQTYLFAFGPLSGLADIAAGLPGTEPPNVFNTCFPGTLLPGDPATTDGASDTGTTYTPGVLGAFTDNGAGR